MNRILTILSLAAALCVALPVTAAAQKGSSVRLVVKNAPPEAKVIINNLAAQAAENGSYTAPAGAVVIQLEVKGIAAYTTSMVFKAGEERTVELTCTRQCATLDIVTDPFGASVYLNGRFEGLTPYVNSFVKPGDYDLDVSMPGHEPVMRQISIKGDKPLVLTLNMEQTQAFRDSIKAVKIAQKKRRQLVQKLLFSGLAAVCGAGGVYFDMDGRSKLTQADDATAAYDKAAADFQGYKDTYNLNREKARKSLGNRDLLYVAAGACVIGFTFSFFF